MQNNLYNFENKVALITGASSGLGEQFAKCFVNVGAKVIITARRLDKLTELTKLSKNIIPIAMDVRDNNSVLSAFNKINAMNLKIDICVNNAGIAKLTPIFDQNENDFEDIIQTNIMGVWYVTKAVAHHMKDNNIKGSIINIASINGQNKLRDEISAYSSSKAAVIQLTKSLVGELAKYNIRINSISPGLFHTPLTDYKLNTDEGRENFIKMIPMKFIAQPNDLDGLLLLLASNEASSYITGSNFTIDGGISWGGN